MQHYFIEHNLTYEIFERLTLFFKNFTNEEYNIITELINVYKTSVKSISVLQENITYISRQIDDKNESIIFNGDYSGKVMCIFKTCRFCMRHTPTDDEDQFNYCSKGCRFCITLRKEKDKAIDREAKLYYQTTYSNKDVIEFDDNIIKDNNNNKKVTTTTTTTTNNTIININYQNITNNITINNNYVFTKDRFYYVCFYTFGKTVNDQITRLKYIFTNLMCGKDGKTLFPNENTTSVASTYTVDAALYSIDNENVRPTLHGLLRFKHIKNKSHITAKRLMDNNRKIDELSIVDTQVTPINLWEGKKHHFCKEHIINAINTIKKYDYFGSLDDDFLKDSSDNS
jgi:hypothetical protein